MPAFHHLWWATWVAGFVIAVAAGVDSAISNVDSAVSAGGSATTTANAGVAVLTSLLLCIAAVLGALVVRRTTDRQESRWQHLAVARPGGEGHGRWIPA